MTFGVPGEPGELIPKATAPPARSAPEATPSTDRAPWSGTLAPVAIGGFIATAAMVIGPVSGGSFNPARSLAPALFAPSAPDLWIYIVGPLAGAIVGGFVYWLLRDPGTQDILVETIIVEED